ncbi:MAG: GNAT family N-acetyltransferase [Thermoleophilia bacterium]
MSDFVLAERLPNVTELRRINESVGWHDLPEDDNAVARGLAASLYGVTVTHEGETVACARVIGDGGIYFYVQDVIVKPAWQGHGVGQLLMDALLRYLRRTVPDGAFVGLMAAAGESQFYERFGFVRRDTDEPGMFMIWQG